MFPVWCIYGARISSCLEQMEAMWYFEGFLWPKNAFYLSAFAKEDVKIMSLQLLRLTAI
jgi:hypothetical protein